MADKQNKKLSLYEQLEKDVASFNQQLIYLDTQVKNVAGAKAYIEKKLKDYKDK